MSHHKNGKLIVFAAPSGAGKTTIVRSLLKRMHQLCFSVSACTRAKRECEIEGKDYYFMTKEEFLEKIHEHEFVEWEEVYADHFYGTLKSEVDRIWDEGKYVVFDIDVKGALSIKNIYKERALTIFVKPPSIDHLRSRLFKRASDSEENIERRVQKAAKEMIFESLFDISLLNDDLETAVKQAEAIVSTFLKSGHAEEE